MLRTDLRKGWSVRAIGGDRSGSVPGSYPAEIPGCVHTDLMAAGVIPDPYLDGNEAELRWMYEIDWRYATVLNPDDLALQPPGPSERVDLVFDGIDTIGTVRLGTMRAEPFDKLMTAPVEAHPSTGSGRSPSTGSGRSPSTGSGRSPSTGSGRSKIELGRTYNMHRSYRFNISPHLTGLPLELEVDLHSATRYAEGERQRLGDRPSAYPSAPFNFIRKMACSFGWDWGPDLRTAGCGGRCDSSAGAMPGWLR
jgi:beta-mannosidase